MALLSLIIHPVAVSAPTPMRVPRTAAQEAPNEALRAGEVRLACRDSAVLVVAAERAP